MYIEEHHWGCNIHGIIYQWDSKCRLLCWCSQKLCPPVLVTVVTGVHYIQCLFSNEADHLRKNYNAVKWLTFEANRVQLEWQSGLSMVWQWSSTAWNGCWCRRCWCSVWIGGLHPHWGYFSVLLVFFRYVLLFLFLVFSVSSDARF
jgi:hypothetical protein